MPIYVEFAPMGLVPEVKVEEKMESEEEEKEEVKEDEPKEAKNKKTIFVKNLNFDTT